LTLAFYNDCYTSKGKATMDKQRYLTFLLRIRRVGPEADDWRIILEHASTGERRGFVGPEQLCDYIQAQAEESEREAVPFPIAES
jgi:hypothetical protein